MNPIWRYLIISDLRKKHKNIIGDMRLANFKMNPEKAITKKGRGWTFIKKKSKNEFEADPRIPINFRPRKWLITPQQVNKVADYIDVNRVQNETKIIEERLLSFEENHDGIIDYLFNNWLVVQSSLSFNL
jgi:hypothetical protein